MDDTRVNGEYNCDLFCDQHVIIRSLKEFLIFVTRRIRKRTKSRLLAVEPAWSSSPNIEILGKNHNRRKRKNPRRPHRCSCEQAQQRSVFPNNAWLFQALQPSRKGLERTAPQTMGTWTGPKLGNISSRHACGARTRQKIGSKKQISRILPASPQRENGLPSVGSREPKLSKP